MYSTRASRHVRATPAQVYAALTDGEGTEAGKSAAHTDTYHGRFVRLVEGELGVEVLEFGTDGPALAGQMAMSTTITPTVTGALVEIVHDRVPDVVRRADNEVGTDMALKRTAALVEAG